MTTTHILPSFWALLVALFLSLITPICGTLLPQTSVNDKHSNHELPLVFPPPQHISSTDAHKVSLYGHVTIVTGNFSDASTIEAVKSIVSSAGGRPTVSKSAGCGTQILLGSESDNHDAVAAAKALTGRSAANLTAEGYVLATGRYNGRPSVILNGVDTRGTFYATQTLRQLVNRERTVPGVQVRDWPLMPVRGSIEGFYGIPWSHQARLDQFTFYGKHKMNTYVYTPKGDNFLRAHWRDLYNSSDLAQLKELIYGANANHVDFTFALSPGLDICYSSDSDFNKTTAKFDQVRKLGVKSFYIALDDIPFEFHCDSDKTKWPKTDDSAWFADAHAYYLNRVQKEYVIPNELRDLYTVPTNYISSAPDPYKKELGTKLDKKIRLQWTGEGVFSPNITVDSVKRADSSYVTESLTIWDNFPVNDGMPNRLFLNSLKDRAPDLYKYLLGFTSNPMVQPYASMISLANFGDYTWNGPAYDDVESMEAVLWELSGHSRHVHKALAAFVDINQNWPYREPEVNATQLSADIASFWAACKSSSCGGRRTKPLRRRLALLASLPQVLPRMEMEGFAADVAPWSTVAMQWARASQYLVAMLDSLDRKDKKEATRNYKKAMEWVEKTKAKTVDDLDDDGKFVPKSITPSTGDGVFDEFVRNATAVYKGQ